MQYNTLMFTQNARFMEALWSGLFFLKSRINAQVDSKRIVEKVIYCTSREFQNARNKRYMGVIPRKIIKKHS